MTRRRNTPNSPNSVGGSEHWYDPEVGIVLVNESSVADGEVMNALFEQRPEVASLMRWRNTFSARGQGGIFQRDRYTTPDEIFKQFQVSQDACLSDDVVSGVLESTESMAFSKMGFECEDEDQEDVWNQIAENLDLDSRFREMWRELFMVSQFYVAMYYGRKSFKVRGKSTKNVTRKKEFRNLYVPLGMTMLDPMKVLPVGNFMFNQEQLVYIADKGEAANFDQLLAGPNTSDLVVNSLIKGKYTPSREEKRSLQEMTGANLDNLYTLDPKFVWRHTLTRPQYQRFADCRMVSVFELLDLKNQLREQDRTALLGGTNFIVLVRIGSDKLPAKQAEVNAVSAMVQQASRVPIMVGDHRLEVDIITPPQDLTLKPERYNTIDARITARLYMILMSGNYAAGAKGDDSIKLSRVIAAGMESRRHMIRRAFERYCLKPTMEANPQLDAMPTLEFHPKRIALDFDPNVASFLQELRDRGDVSRDTVLLEVDLDETQEARKRQREKERYDDIFQPTVVPYSTPPNKIGSPGADNKPGATKTPGGATNPKAAGRKGGGNSNGGGSNPKAGSNPDR